MFVVGGQRERQLASADWPRWLANLAGWLVTFLLHALHALPPAPDACLPGYLLPAHLPPRLQVSDKMDPSQLVALIATLNPENTPGRLAVIVRMGATKLREKLPTLLEAVASAGQVVAWVCDPMHGNTEEVQGFKTRRYDNIRAEVEAFFDVHDECGTVPGGIHLEMTGEPASQAAMVEKIDLRGGLGVWDCWNGLQGAQLPQPTAICCPPHSADLSAAPLAPLPPPCRRQRHRVHWRRRPGGRA